MLTHLFYTPHKPKQMAKRKKRYQIIKQLISAKDTEYNISVELDKQYERVTRIYAYGNPNYTQNNNLVFSSPLKINNTDHFPEDFDSALLFPIDHNDDFTKIDEEAAGSRLEVTLQDKGTVASPYYFSIVLVLENKHD